MLSVAQALDLIFDLVTPLDAEEVALDEAAGRVLLRATEARRDQPPFPASAMDGYALRHRDAIVGARLKVVGEAAAGHRFPGRIGAGECARIFTGAPVPAGADCVVIQENVLRDGKAVVIESAPEQGYRAGLYIRPAGTDFKAGDRLEAPRRLSANDLALLAAMNVPRVQVARRPVVALLATGDELVMPGETPGPDQIIASNSFGLKALAQAAGARVRILPIARDNVASLETVFDLARDADLIVTVGGASVGDHDLVGKVAAGLGMDRAFYKIAMRPGKPLMAGKLAGSVLIGLPGNPVSSIVCGHIFMLPAIRVLQGLPPGPAPRERARLANDLPENGAREHYMRARVEAGEITAFERQDSALLSVLSQANALLVRPVADPARKVGETVEYVPI